MSEKETERSRHSRRPRPVADPADPWSAGVSRPLLLPASKLEILSEGQIEQIHEASLSILSRTGLVFDSLEVVEYFRHAGARVDGYRVHLEPDLIEKCLAKAPAEYELRARNPINNVTIGGDNCAVMPGGGAPYVLDLEGKRRPGTLADVENFTRLSALSPSVHVMTRKPTEPQDIPVPMRHLVAWQAILTLSDKPCQSGFVGGRPEAEDVLQMLAIVHGGEGAIDGQPVAHCSVSVNSPLQYDRPMLESLLLFASYGQPVLLSPFVMAGVTGPTTMAGSLAQHNAEVLAGMALVQLVRTGTPVVYGTASSNVDMRNAAPATGSPESGISIAACAQLARRYGLPFRGGGALTDSPIPDAQSNYERMYSLLISALSGVNFMMHGLGILESYLTISYEQFVIDLELLEMVRQFIRPLEVSAETLALDAIHDVGPGGHFLESKHTMRHFRDAHFIPHISQRLSYEQWLEQGAKDARQRANERCRELLASYEKPPIDPGMEDQLRDYVARRLESADPPPH